VSDVVNPAFIKRLIIATARIINPVTELKLFIKFAEYINVFNTEKTDVLSTYNKNEHTINLNGDEPFFGPLYNLLIKELKVLKTYLNAALAKK
jgi:hypothetical protein